MKALYPLLTVALLGGATVAGAQNRQSYDTNVFNELISAQLTKSLDSPLSMVRTQTLKNAIVYSTLYRGRVDLSEAVSRIAKLAREDESHKTRRLAVAALHAIGSYRADRYLAKLEGMEDDEYRMLVAGVLSEYNELHRTDT